MPPLPCPYCAEPVPCWACAVLCCAVLSCVCRPELLCRLFTIADGALDRGPDVPGCPFAGSLVKCRVCIVTIMSWFGALCDGGSERTWLCSWLRVVSLCSLVGRRGTKKHRLEEHYLAFLYCNFFSPSEVKSN